MQRSPQRFARHYSSRRLHLRGHACAGVARPAYCCQVAEAQVGGRTNGRKRERRRRQRRRQWAGRHEHSVGACICFAAGPATGQRRDTPPGKRGGGRDHCAPASHLLCRPAGIPDGAVHGAASPPQCARRAGTLLRRHEWREAERTVLSGNGPAIVTARCFGTRSGFSYKRYHIPKWSHFSIVQQPCAHKTSQWRRVSAQISVTGRIVGAVSWQLQEGAGRVGGAAAAACGLDAAVDAVRARVRAPVRTTQNIVCAICHRQFGAQVNTNTGRGLQIRSDGTPPPPPLPALPSRQRRARRAGAADQGRDFHLVNPRPVADSAGSQQQQQHLAASSFPRLPPQAAAPAVRGPPLAGPRPHHAPAAARPRLRGRSQRPAGARRRPSATAAAQLPGQPPHARKVPCTLLTLAHPCPSTHPWARPRRPQEPGAAQLPTLLPGASNATAPAWQPDAADSGWLMGNASRAVLYVGMALCAFVR